MSALLKKYQPYVWFSLVLVVMVFVFRFRESELNQQLNDARQQAKKALIKQREQVAAQQQAVTARAIDTIVVYRTRNENRKKRLNEKPAAITAPVHVDSVLAVLNGAKRKL